MSVPFLALTPIERGRELVVRATLASFPADHGSPLAGVPGTHYGRWLVLDRLPWQGPPQRPDPLRCKYLLFTAVHDEPGSAGPKGGTTWLDGLGARLGEHADRIWGDCEGYPGADGLAPWLRRHQIRPHLFYSAYGATVDKVLDAIMLRAALTDFVVGHQGVTDPDVLRDEWRERFSMVAGIRGPDDA